MIRVVDSDAAAHLVYLEGGGEKKLLGNLDSSMVLIFERRHAIGFGEFAAETVFADMKARSKLIQRKITAKIFIKQSF